MAFATIQEAAAEIRDGRMIIIVDDEDRENEGDLVCAAEKITPEIINFMARHAPGLICLPLTEERCDELHLTTQVADNTSYLGTAFTVSIDARRGITTGISAADRATTILVAVEGISLTIGGLSDDHFEVAIIPKTWVVTNLSHLKPGDAVNLEVDVIGKYVDPLLAHS